MVGLEVLNGALEDRQCALVSIVGEADGIHALRPALRKADDHFEYWPTSAYPIVTGRPAAVDCVVRTIVHLQRLLLEAGANPKRLGA